MVRRSRVASIVHRPQRMAREIVASSGPIPGSSFRGGRFACVARRLILHSRLRERDGSPILRASARVTFIARALCSALAVKDLELRSEDFP
jgi:hypothetical protein